MPSITKKICNKCNSIVELPHNCVNIQANREYNKFYRTNEKFYNSYEWKKKRLSILKRDGGLCKECFKIGIVEVGNIVDHIIPLKANYELRLDDSNLQTLCSSCHNKKTAEENKI